MFRFSELSVGDRFIIQEQAKWGEVVKVYTKADDTCGLTLFDGFSIRLRPEQHVLRLRA